MIKSLAVTKNPTSNTVHTIPRPLQLNMANTTTVTTPIAHNKIIQAPVPTYRLNFNAGNVKYFRTRIAKLSSRQRACPDSLPTINLIASSRHCVFVIRHH